MIERLELRILQYNVHKFKDKIIIALLQKKENTRTQHIDNTKIVMLS